MEPVGVTFDEHLKIRKKQRIYELTRTEIRRKYAEVNKV
jgi:hypothetical protein